VAFLQFEQVECRRGGRAVLEDLSFVLDQRETLVLLGRSGSGKTTVLQLIIRLLRCSRGRITFNGGDLGSQDPIELRRRIGYVIQEVGLLPHWTVARNIAMVPALCGWPSDRIEQRTRELLEQVQLPFEQFAHRYPHQLSGGQRQRVGVARALAADPALLLFDEPFGALDPISRQEMQNQFLDLQSQYGKAAIFVTHDVTEALRLGTKIAVLESGRLEIIASRDEFIDASTPVARAFLNTLPAAPVRGDVR
jgi:osmoprotectant transport system ATP-binding protein